MVITIIGVAGFVVQLIGYRLPHMPLWAWLIVVFVGISIAQFLAFNKVRGEFQNLRSSLETNKSKKEIGSTLAAFHIAGKELFSRGINDENQLAQWVKEGAEWKSAVESYIKDNISPGEASIFGLAVVDGVEAKNKWKHEYNKEHRGHIHFLNHRMQKLDDLIKRGRY